MRRLSVEKMIQLILARSLLVCEDVLVYLYQCRLSDVGCGSRTASCVMLYLLYCRPYLFDIRKSR